MGRRALPPRSDWRERTFFHSLKVALCHLRPLQHLQLALHGELLILQLQSGTEVLLKLHGAMVFQ
jgi:hypothetical protein